MDPNRKYAVPLLVLAVAFLVRLLFCFVVYPRIADQFGPGDGYDAIAHNIASGRGYILDAIDAPAERLPLYPLLLAVSFKFFGSAEWPWQVLQALLGATTCAVVYVLARRHSQPRAALTAAIFCSLHPTLLLYTARPLTEVVYTFLLVLFVYAATQRRDALAGVWGACGMLVKSTASIHLVVLLALRSLEWEIGLRTSVGTHRQLRPPGLATLAMIAGAAIVVLSPWAMWNVARFGTPHLRTATGGRALYHGLYISRQVGWATPSADSNVGAELELRGDLAKDGIAADADVSLRDRVAGDLASQWIATHRVETLRLWLRNLLLTWYLGRSRTSMLIHALLHGPLLVLAVIGAQRLWRVHPAARDSVALCGALVVAYTLLHAVVQPAVRYVLPAVPLAAVLAAGAARRLDAAS